MHPNECATDYKEHQKFSAEKFVDDLLTKGDELLCDDSCEQFNQVEVLPAYYNQQTFKRGQQFYHDNIMGMFFAKLLGLIINLALPKALKILEMTRMSSTPMTAYRRYMQTVFHMCLWYDKDFHPGSQSWASIFAVKAKHNSASKRGNSAGFGGLTQKDMALAQFGFMGFALVRGDWVGVHPVNRVNDTDDDDTGMGAFVHLWRVLGHLFGIDDRFNLCRESLEETRQICNVVLDRVLRPEMNKMDVGFRALSDALITGMWAMNPVLEHHVFLAYIEIMVRDVPQTGHNHLTVKSWGEPELITLSGWQRFHLRFILVVIYSLRYGVARVILNWMHHLSLWLMVHCPYLAYRNYGYENSHVTILDCPKC